MSEETLPVDLNRCSRPTYVQTMLDFGWTDLEAAIAWHTGREGGSDLLVEGDAAAPVEPSPKGAAAAARD